MTSQADVLVSLLHMYNVQVQHAGTLNYHMSHITGENTMLQARYYIHSKGQTSNSSFSTLNILSVVVLSFHSFMKTLVEQCLCVVPCDKGKLDSAVEVKGFNHEKRKGRTGKGKQGKALYNKHAALAVPNKT